MKRYLEALRQRQIIMEHLRRANVFSTDYGCEDIDYFVGELVEINAVVETMWLEQAIA